MVAGFAGFTAITEGDRVGSATCRASEIASQEASPPSTLWNAAAPPVEGRTVTWIWLASVGSPAIAETKPCSPASLRLDSRLKPESIGAKTKLGPTGNHDMRTLLGWRTRGTAKWLDPLTDTSQRKSVEMIL